MLPQIIWSAHIFESYVIVVLSSGLKAEHIPQQRKTNIQMKLKIQTMKVT